MTRAKRMVLVVFAVSLTACTTPTRAPNANGREAHVDSRTHPVYEPRAVKSSPPTLEPAGCDGDEFDFQTHGPIEFLDYLVAAASDGSNSDRTVSYSIYGTHRGWIHGSDLADLVALFDSTTPCLSVSMTTSSFMSMELSTVGHEAAFLVAGFRADVEETGYGGYPPSLESVRANLDKDELRAWCVAYLEDLGDAERGLTTA